MRGNQDFQGGMFSYISLEERVPAAHPLRKLRAVVDALLASMNSEFEAVYARPPCVRIVVAPIKPETRGR